MANFEVDDHIPVTNPPRVNKRTPHFLGILSHLKKNPPVTIASTALLNDSPKQTEGTDVETGEFIKKNSESQYHTKINRSVSYADAEDDLSPTSSSCSRNEPRRYSSGDRTYPDHNTPDSKSLRASCGNFQRHNSPYNISTEKYRSNNSRYFDKSEESNMESVNIRRQDEYVHHSENKNFDLRSKLTNKNSKKSHNSENLNLCEGFDESDFITEGVHDKFALFRGPRQHSGHKFDHNERKHRKSCDSFDSKESYENNPNTKYVKGTINDKLERNKPLCQYSRDKLELNESNLKILNKSYNEKDDSDRGARYDKFTTFRSPRQYSGDKFGSNGRNRKISNDSFDEKDDHLNYDDNKCDRDTYDKFSAFRDPQKNSENSFNNKINHKTYEDSFGQKNYQDSADNSATHDKFAAFRASRQYSGDKFGSDRRNVKTSDDSFDQRDDHLNYGDNKCDRDITYDKFAAFRDPQRNSGNNYNKRNQKTNNSFDRRDDYRNYANTKYNSDTTFDKFAAFRKPHQYSDDKFDSNEISVKTSRNSFNPKNDCENHVTNKFDGDTTKRLHPERFSSKFHPKSNELNSSVEIDEPNRRFNSNYNKPRNNNSGFKNAKGKDFKNVDTSDIYKAANHSEFSRNIHVRRISNISDDENKLSVTFQTTDDVSKIPELTQCLEWEETTSNLNERSSQNLDESVSSNSNQTSSSQVKRIECDRTFNKSPELTDCLEWNVEESTTSNLNESNIQSLSWNFDESDTMNNAVSKPTDVHDIGWNIDETNSNQNSKSKLKTAEVNKGVSKPLDIQNLEWNFDETVSNSNKYSTSQIKETGLNNTASKKSVHIQNNEWNIDDSISPNSNKNSSFKSKTPRNTNYVARTPDIQSIDCNYDKKAIQSNSNKYSTSQIKETGLNNTASKKSVHIQNHEWNIDDSISSNSSFKSKTSRNTNYVARTPDIQSIDCNYDKNAIQSNSNKYSNPPIKETCFKDTVSKSADIQSLEWDLDA